MQRLAPCPTVDVSVHGIKDLLGTLTLLAVAAFDFGPVLGKGTFPSEVPFLIAVTTGEVRRVLRLGAFVGFVALLTVCC